MSERVVWKLVIQKSGLSDRVLHESLHENVNSAVAKSKSVLTYDVPDRGEWYDNSLWCELGYVLDRDEIDTWPVRIEVMREDVLNEAE